MRLTTSYTLPLLGLTTTTNTFLLHGSFSSNLYNNNGVCAFTTTSSPQLSYRSNKQPIANRHIFAVKNNDGPLVQPDNANINEQQRDEDVRSKNFNSSNKRENESWNIASILGGVATSQLHVTKALATTASLLLALDTTTSPTDIDASTLPKESIVELTSSSDASKSSLVIVDDDTTKSGDEKNIEEIQPKSAITSGVTSESLNNADTVVVDDDKKDSEVVDAAMSIATPTTESTAVVEKESSSGSTKTNKQDEKSAPAPVTEEYKAMKSIIDNYKSSKKQSSPSSDGSSSSTAIIKPESTTNAVFPSDLKAIAVPGLLIASIVGVASSFLNNRDDELEGEGGGGVAMDDKKKAGSSSSSEWKMEQPTPYGLQDTTPKYYPPPGQEVQEEKKPIEPTSSAVVKGQNKSKYFGATSPSSPTLPKPTSKIKASKSISMANIVKEAKKSSSAAAAKKTGIVQKGGAGQEKWKGYKEPAPYGLKEDTPKYTKMMVEGEKLPKEPAQQAVSTSLKGSLDAKRPPPALSSSTTKKSDDASNISMANIVKGTADPTQVKQRKNVLTLDSKGRKVWKLEESSSWIKTLATGSNSSKQKGDKWKGIQPKGEEGQVKKKKEERKEVEPVYGYTGKKAGSDTPKPAKLKATKSISMANIVKGASTSTEQQQPQPQQQSAMFNSLPTKGASSTKASTKKSWSKTSLKGALKAAQSAIDSGTTSSTPSSSSSSSSSSSPATSSSATSSSSSPSSSDSSSVTKGPVNAVPTPSYSAKSTIMKGGNNNSVNKSFAKGSYKKSSGTIASSSAAPGGGGVGSSSSVSSSMPSAGLSSGGVMKGASSSPPPSSSSSSSSGRPKSYAKSSFKTSGTSGKGAPPGGWAVSSSSSNIVPSPASTSAPATPVSSSSSSPAAPLKGVQTAAQVKSISSPGPTKSYKKASYAKSSGSGMLKGSGMFKSSSSPLFGNGPTPKTSPSSTSFGKTVTNKKKTFGKSISMANIMKGGSGDSGSGGVSGGSKGAGKDGGVFLSGLEQSSVPSSSSANGSASSSSSNAAVLLPKSEVPSTPVESSSSEVSSPTQTNDEAEQQQPGQQQRSNISQPIGQPVGQQFGMSISGVRGTTSVNAARIGSPTRFGNTPPNNVQSGARVVDSGTSSAAAATSEQEEERSGPMSVTITDPRTGKKRTISTSTNKNLRP